MNELDKSADGRVRQPAPTSRMLLGFDMAEEIRRLNSEQPWQAEHTQYRSGLTAAGSDASM